MTERLNQHRRESDSDSAPIFFLPQKLERALWKKAIFKWMLQPRRFLIVLLLSAVAYVCATLIVPLFSMPDSLQGFISAALAAGLVGAYVALGRRTMARYVREELAMMPDRCTNCGYPIKNAMRCPECGRIVTGNDVKGSGGRQRHRGAWYMKHPTKRVLVGAFGVLLIGGIWGFNGPVVAGDQLPAVQGVHSVGSALATNIVGAGMFLLCIFDIVQCVRKKIAASRTRSQR